MTAFFIISLLSFWQKIIKKKLKEKKLDFSDYLMYSK